MPFAQRIPKLPGFKNPFKKFYSVVNVSKLSRFEDETKVDAALLIEAGLVHPGLDIKILGTGRLNRKLTVEVHSISVSAREAIEKRGGTVKVLGEPRKIGPRRTAAKAPRALPAENAAPATAEQAEPAEKRAKGGKAPKAEQPVREKRAPLAADDEEATPPAED